MSCFKDKDEKLGRDAGIAGAVDGLARCSLVRELVSHVLGDPPESDGRAPFFRIVLRSLMDEGGFTRLAIQGGPARWVEKGRDLRPHGRPHGDLFDGPPRPGLAGWMVHQVVSGFPAPLPPQNKR